MALIPEVVALEKKLGKVKGSDKDRFLDQIIENLKQKSKLGKMWENAEKARQESVKNMLKEDETRQDVNDVVKKALEDTTPKTPTKKETAVDKELADKSAK